MKRIRKFSQFAIIFIGILFISYSHEAHAVFRIGLWWNVVQELTNSEAHKGGLGLLGVGSTFEYSPFHLIGFETGAFLQPIILDSALGHRVVVPLMLRFWLIHNLTAAVGGYYSYQISNLASNVSVSNQGLRTTFGLNFPYTKEENAALAVEVGYQYSPTNISTDSLYTLYESQILIQIGFRFGGARSMRTVGTKGRLPSLPYVLATPPTGSGP